MPVAICSTPKARSTGIPDEWALQSVPGRPARAISGAVTSAGIAGSVRGKKCQSQGTGTPASSQWPEGVSLPRETSVAAAQIAADGSGMPGVSAPEAARIAGASPSAASDGTLSGPLLPSSA